MLSEVALSVLLAPCLGTRLPTLSVGIVLLLRVWYTCLGPARFQNLLAGGVLLARHDVGLAGQLRAAHVPLKSARCILHDVDRVFI